MVGDTRRDWEPLLTGSIGIFFDFFLRTTPEIAAALGFPDADFPPEYPPCDMPDTRRCTMDGE